ncbi:MAG: N-glycosylase/DNA lyase [Candidatus Aenigmarchaeota archaeon]|nr:N-glycosylase/DNA lyase [Candidatus Aenigmarchaeota archaeon]
MESLAAEIKEIRKGVLKATVDKRLGEFRELGKGKAEKLFKELCFCLLTANYSAEGGIRIQKSIGDGFLKLPREELASMLRKLGHRFPEARAGYIVSARKHMDSFDEVLSKSGNDARNWLVKNVKGLGYKEASHFLRNIGFNELAIVDFHIVDILVRNSLIERPKTITPKKYIEIENILRNLGKSAGMNMAELDLYLWYMETGKVLK